MSEPMQRKRSPMGGHGGHQMGGGGEKAKDFKAAWGKLFSYLGRYKIQVILALIFSGLSAVLTLVGPEQLRLITNVIENGIKTGIMDLDKVAAIGVFLIAVYAASALLNFIQNYMLSTVSQKTCRNLRSEISGKINRLPLRYFDNSSTGDTLSRVTNDVDTIGQSMNQSLSTLASSITMLLGAIVMMMVTNVPMAITAMLSSVAGFALVIVIMSRSQKYFSMLQDNLGLMNGHIEETYSGHNIVKVYNAQGDARKTFDGINENLRKGSFRSQFLSGLMMPLMNFIGNFGYVMVCIAGAVLVLNGEITVGTIVAFIVYVRLFTQPFSQLAQAFTYMQSVAAASERVFEMLEEPEMEDDSGKTAKLENVKGEVEFRDVHFGYTPGKEVIHGFSAKISPGQKVAIVGPTGAGKTTMVNLLMKFYDVNSGDILIDGVSIKDLSRSEVRKQFCMVLQDTWMFDGTVRENVAYCKENVTDEMLENACKAVVLHHLITTLPNGYDTVLKESMGISSGQKQQLTIARAIVDDSPMLILDEATSSVDTRTERIIQKAMDGLSAQRTSFVIAHRLSTIKNSDLILVMKDGSIIEQGNHEELLARGGFYCDLYNSQFEVGD